MMRRECDDLDNGSVPSKQARMDGCSPLGGPPPQHQGGNLYLPPTPFQEKLIANNPFDDSHNASAHLKGNLAKNFPPGKGQYMNRENGGAIYPCGVCHKEVHDNDQAVFCESGCNFWFHRICTGLTEAAFHMLTQEVAAEWVCDKCVQTKNVPLVRFKQ